MRQNGYFYLIGNDEYAAVCSKYAVVSNMCAASVQGAFSLIGMSVNILTAIHFNFDGGAVRTVHRASSR